jgi:hypothetical protein
MPRSHLARLRANPARHVVRDQDRAGTVASEAAFPHGPLVLTVGTVADRQRHYILVITPCVEPPASRRIVALFTTDQNRGEAGN